MEICCTTLPSSPIHQSHYIKQEWSLIKTLYHERFTKVDMLYHITFMQRGALKTYRKCEMTEKEIEKRQKYIETEIQIHRILDGISNVVPLWFYYKTEDEWGLMTKYMNRGTLSQYVYKYKLEGCILHEIIYPLLNTLSYIHTNRIVHRDLKPDNIFVHHNQIYIGDFGYSCILENEEEYATGFIGTLQYMAPELLHGFLTKETYLLKYRYEVDIWSLGIIVYELLFHKKPFGWSEYRNICKHNPTDPTFIQTCLETPLDFPRHISVHAKDFLKKCLEHNPQQRANVKELLEHPWITTYLKTKDVLSHKRCPLELESNPNQNQKEASGQKAHQKELQTSFWKNQCTIS